MEIKEKLRNFGILVIRRFWPIRGRKGIQQLGILALGIGVLLGVSQAGTIQRLIRGSIDSSAEPTATKFVGLSEKIVPTAASATDAARQEKVAGAPNIVHLIDESELIVQGMVKEVSDGFENGVPYTQVTVEVSESIRGKVGKELTFRQFGLLEPRKMSNGKVNLNVTPAGWAKYDQADSVVLFLGRRASLTGLRTTVGLGQGKITLKGGNAESQFGNAGLFENVVADTKALNDSDKRVLATKKGPVNKDAFLSFVRKAVNDKWVEGGKLRHAKK